MINKVKELFNTEISHCFTSAVKRCNMEHYGYVEREFLFNGTANIYETGKEKTPVVKYSNCEYTDRMTLRHPSELSKFSGRVIIEIVNSTANFDIDRIWAEVYRYLMRNGDIFVGVTSKANVFCALKRFDPTRYADLNWPNPNNEPVPGNDIPPIWNGPQDQENGYIWDILKELPSFLRSGAEINPLKDWDIKYIYLTGWSQSCSYITQFINSFEKTDSHAYDGYLSAGGVRSFATPINRYEEGKIIYDSVQKRLNYAPAPVIEINTESEASDEFDCCGYSSRRDDSDDPYFRYRYMDIAGGCHDAVDTCMAYNSFDDDVAKAMGKRDEGLPGNNLCMNNYPKYFAFHVALRTLYQWVENGAAPKSYERMRQSSKGVILKDAFGNSMGGMRTPMLNYPVCTYFNWSEVKDPQTSEKRINHLSGHEAVFTSEFLKELYGDLKHYRELVTEDAKRLASAGHILEEDMEEVIEVSVKRAAAAGLK